ncbi:MAG: sensor histidine kinase [Clostridia bacterium]|nr:sensor histidine kinase [Clostridia bacterium]MBN2882939.1 sensor histidine kinase [Clostridia bacterium]
MSVDQIIPILVPGALIQLALQIYYIKQCWENQRLSQGKKALWIVMIAMFNLPAIAVYLIVTREKTSNDIDYIDNRKVDRNIKQAVSVILYLFFMVFTITILFNNHKRDDFNLIVILLSVNFVLLAVSWFLNNDRGRYLHYIIPVVSLAAAAYVNYLDDYSTTTLIFLVIAANIINNHSPKSSKIYGIMGFILFIGLETAALYKGGAVVSTDELIGFIYLNSAIYILVLLAFYLLKRQMILNVRLKELISEISEKGKALEEMTVISERNKIAGEIHDTVGHTLTTAMISLDVAAGEIGNDDKKASEIIALARQQIKKGMDDIRYSVRTIKHGHDDGDFETALSIMIQELEKSANIKINSVLDINENPIPIHKNLIYRVIKECITNSMKHSGCTEADILITESGGILNYTYSDNGKGADEIKEGFGLSNIREMSKAMGGNAVYTSAEGEGFTMNIQIPTGREVFND